jgi:hypothetical protein
MKMPPAPALCLLLLAAVLAGCASSSADKAGQAVGQAATQPLQDLNVVRAEIPPPLLAAQKAPYALPADRSCAAIADEVRALDAVLGADLDTRATDRNPSLIERGAADALRNTAEGVIPFRGWVRRLTGAERYSREVAAAIAAGTVRRAYLKGFGQSAGCATPAAPSLAPPAAPASAPLR